MPQQQQSKTVEDDPISKEVAKLLTHVEASVREKTVVQIGKWLKLREQQCKPKPIENAEFQKLWKALYYCFWMTDKVPIQQEMGNILSSTLSSHLSLNENIQRFFCNFFAVLRREWILIDYLRLNKFLSLIRQMINSWLRKLDLTKAEVSKEILSFVEYMRSEVLFPTQPDGLRMQIAFVYLPELCKITSGNISEPILRELLSPFLCVLLDPPTDSMFNSTVKDVFQSLESNQFGDDANPLSFKHLDKSKVGQCIFEMAAEDETLTSGARKQLYTLAKRFQRSTNGNGTTEHSTADSKSILSPSVLKAKRTKQERLLEKHHQQQRKDEEIEDEAINEEQIKPNSSVKKKLRMDDSETPKSIQKKSLLSKSKQHQQTFKNVPHGEDMDVEDEDDDVSEEEEMKSRSTKKKAGQIVNLNNKIVKDVVTPAATTGTGEKSKKSPGFNELTTPSVKKASASLVPKSLTTPNENKPPAKKSSDEQMSSPKLSPNMKKEATKDTNKAKSVTKSTAMEERAASTLDQSFDSTTSSTSSKKNVRFSHKDIMKIPAITKKMKETQKTSADLGIPTKSLLKKTSSSSLTPKSTKSSLSAKKNKQ